MSGRVIRYHTKNYQKYLYFPKKLTLFRTRYKQIWYLWCHFGDMMSPESQGVLKFLKKETQAAIERKDWAIIRSHVVAPFVACLAHYCVACEVTQRHYSPSAGTRRFNSSNQLVTTCNSLTSESSKSGLSTRKRPSGATS